MKEALFLPLLIFPFLSPLPLPSSHFSFYLIFSTITMNTPLPQVRSRLSTRGGPCSEVYQSLCTGRRHWRASCKDSKLIKRLITYVNDVGSVMASPSSRRTIQSVNRVPSPSTCTSPLPSPFCPLFLFFFCDYYFFLLFSVYMILNLALFLYFRIFSNPCDGIEFLRRLPLPHPSPLLFSFIIIVIIY